MQIRRWIPDLREIALKSDIQVSKHAAIILDPRRPKWCQVVSMAYNKRDIRDRTQRSSTEQNVRHFTLHAEVNAITQKKSTIRRSSGLVMIVIKVNKVTHELEYSEPCENCKRFCEKYNIRTIYYS